MKKTIINISLLSVFICLAGCGGSDKNNGSDRNNNNDMSVDSVKTDVNEDTAQSTVMYNIPSPIETFTILKISGAAFDKSLLNPANNITKYVSSFSKSVNLGAYSADLSFCLLYKQNQDVNIYLKNVNDLTTALDIDGNYVQLVAQRLKTNTSNLDSIMQIVSEATVNADLYLKENQRDNTTALITAGGWIEGMYFITNIADKTQKRDVINLVAEQKNVIKNLVKVLEQFNNDKEIEGLLTDIKDISAIYETLKPVRDVALASTEKNVVSIGNNQSYELSDKQLKLIAQKVGTLRNKLTV